MRSSSAGLVGTIDETTGAGGEGTARKAAYQIQQTIRVGDICQEIILTETIGRAEVITGGRVAAGGGGGGAATGASSSQASVGPLADVETAARDVP